MLLFGTTSYSQRIASYKFGNKIKIETYSNFKGVQGFLKKNLINSIKFYLPKIELMVILHWHTCIRILEVPLSENMYFSKFQT
jgi:diketogulonate reductase-like aldo/keto reductase